MLKKFLNSEISIKITKKEAHLLKELQDYIGDYRFGSGARIDEKAPIYIEKYGTIFLYVWFPSGQHNCIFVRATEYRTAVDIVDFLPNKVNIEENEIEMIIGD